METVSRCHFSPFLNSASWLYSANLYTRNGISEVLNSVERYSQMIDDSLGSRIIRHEFDREKGLIDHPNILEARGRYFLEIFLFQDCPGKTANTGFDAVLY